MAAYTKENTKPITSEGFLDLIRSFDSFNPGPTKLLHVSKKNQNTIGGGCAYLMVVILFNYVFWTNLI